MSIRPIDPNRPTAIPAKRIAALPPGDNPPPRRRRAATGVDAAQEPIVPDPAHPLAAEEPQPDPRGEPAPKPAQRRGHARRNADGKFEPTGDYPAGFARPPVHTRFDGSKPGPGRPKGLRSQASYLREALDETLTLTENGIQRKIKKRQAAAKIFVKAGLENPDKLVMFKLLAEAERLYPERLATEAAASPWGDAKLDRMLIEQLLTLLSLGEPDPEAEGAGEAAPDEPASDAGDAAEDDAWSEGDWDAPGDAMPVEDGRDDDGDDGGDADEIQSEENDDD